MGFAGEADGVTQLVAFTTFSVLAMSCARNTTCTRSRSAYAAPSAASSSMA